MSIFAKMNARCKAYNKAHGIPEDKRTLKERIAEQKQRQIDGEKKTAAETILRNREAAAERTAGRSGIKERHQHCTFDNYRVTCDQQAEALVGARFYRDNFDNKLCFIFHGTPGTGKNHLASAIGHELMGMSVSVLIMTVSEIYNSIYATYNYSPRTEMDVYRDLCSFDLLVIDEVGRTTDQRRSDKERQIIDEVIDQRYNENKSTGLITNLGLAGLEDAIGYRALDRMQEDNPVIIEFNWNSFRVGH